MKKPQLLPGIDEYLESINDNFPINTIGLEFLKEAIVSRTNLNEKHAELIVKYFFQHIRNQLLRKKIIDIRKFGRFFISSPDTTENSKKIFVKFKPKKILLKKINGIKE